MAQVSTKVQSLINGSSVVVFTKSLCPFCISTRKTLDGLKVDYALLELDKESDGAAIQDALQEISGQRTVPNIFIQQKHIGGNSDLQDLYKSGKLETLLKEAGALKA